MVGVRTAGPEDAPAAGRLLDAFNREYDARTPGADWLAQRLVELMGRGGTLVLLAGDGPDGIAVVRVRPGLWSAGFTRFEDGDGGLSFFYELEL